MKTEYFTLVDEEGRTAGIVAVNNDREFGSMIQENTIHLDGIGGYNKDVIKNFNEAAKNYSNSNLLETILTSSASDEDIKGITEHLENKTLENKKYFETQTQ